LGAPHKQEVHHWSSPHEIILWFLIGLQVGINAKWINTIKNVIADKILRLKRTNEISPLSSTYELTYDYSNLQQEHEELKACNSFQPSPKLLSLILEILLTQRCPDLSLILSLKPHGCGARLGGAKMS
jgi:hypothetical protein